MPNEVLRAALAHEARHLKHFEYHLVATHEKLGKLGKGLLATASVAFACACVSGSGRIQEVFKNTALMASIGGVASCLTGLGIARALEYDADKASLKITSIEAATEVLKIYSETSKSTPSYQILQSLGLTTHPSSEQRLQALQKLTQRE